MVLMCAIFVIAMRTVLSGGESGLALSYALQITGLLNMTVRLAAMAENSLNAVERVQQYSVVKSEKVEADPDSPPPPADWPSGGKVTFQGVSMKYREDLPKVRCRCHEC
jgi:ATP-binding cassette subfamily C (CFTR/MRP) protein 5